MKTGSLEVSVSHILVAEEAVCAKLKKDFDNLAGSELSLETLQLKFAELAQQHSTCPSSKKGGSLGSFGPGTNAPKFDEVCWLAPIGVVQGPVQTGAGFHLILVTERKEYTVTGRTVVAKTPTPAVEEPHLTFFINTFGTHGDVEPFVALGIALRAAGNEVTVCTAERFKPFVEAHGLRYGFASDGILKLIDTDAGKGVVDGGKESCIEYFRKVRTLMQEAGPLQTQAINESWVACKACKPDVIIYHPKAMGAPHFAEMLGVPAVLVALQPLYVPTGEVCHMLAPSLPFHSPWYNRTTYAAFLALVTMGTAAYSREWRASVGLPPSPPSSSPLTQANGDELLVLHAHSANVIPRPSDWPAWAVTTGFWPLPATDAWQPPEALARFLAAGAAPVYIGFGSMKSSDPAALTRLAIAALTAAGVRGVVATGWGATGPTADLPENVFVFERAPHSWLFPRMAAVVHHGGAGTTAAGLLAGKPAIVCPFFADQPFWGQRVFQLGVGSEPIPQARLTADRLAAAITLVISDTQIRERATSLGERLRAEDGAAAAVVQLEALARGSVGPGCRSRAGPRPCW